MSDRHALAYLLFLLLQLPFFYSEGQGHLGFEWAATRAEDLLTSPASPERKVAIEKALGEIEQHLGNVEDRDSRPARLELARALWAWAEGRAKDAEIHFLKTIQIYARTHGPDSFHANAVRLRYAEFVMLNSRYGEGVPLFEGSLGPVIDFVGPEHKFVVRMRFRLVGALTFLGRRGEAATLARESMAGLYRKCGQMDPAFLSQTGGVLGILTHSALIAPPPEGESWKGYLTQLHQAQKDQVDAGDADAARK